MFDPISESKRKIFAVMQLLFFTVIIGGCAAPNIAPDILAQAKQMPTPLVSNAVTVNVTINPKINNAEKIDDKVKQSLELALKNANIFGPDSSHPYKIDADVLIASESAWSFGSFDNRLQINYAVFDDTGTKILEKEIFTEAGSDKWYFAGYKRHQRARAFNIAKNVLQFVDALQNELKK
jgi:hypothetical protein